MTRTIDRLTPTRMPLSVLALTGLLALVPVGLAPAWGQEPQDPKAPPPANRAPAPDFTLDAVDGQRVTLSELKGSLVVLEWFDPECPQVAAHHQGPQDVSLLAGRYHSRLRWFAIASGKAALNPDRLVQAAREWQIGYPILLDPSGEVSRAFGASVTPEVFLIDDQGQLRYQGAVYEKVNTSDVLPLPAPPPAAGPGPDPAPPRGPINPPQDQPDPDVKPEGAPLREPGQPRDPRAQAEPAPRRPLEQAIESVLSGQPVEQPRTRAYGCPLQLPPTPEPLPGHADALPQDGVAPVDTRGQPNAPQGVASVDTRSKK